MKTVKKTKKQALSTATPCAKQRRTLSQNALFWCWVGQIAGVTGIASRDVHDYYCNRLLKRRVELNGHLLDISGSTRHLSQAEFSAFLTHMQADAKETFGVTLSHPTSLPPQPASVQTNQVTHA